MSDANEVAQREKEDGVFDGLNQLHRSLVKLDERGLVLSLAAFAEDALGFLLKAFMLPTDAAHQLLEGFNAPLGTFSSRIKAAYSLGLVTKDQFEDLEHLRKIRNEFAHSWQHVDFTHPKIAGHIKAINYSRLHDDFPESSLEKMRGAISSLLIELSSAAHQLEKNRRRVRITATHLIAGFSGDFDQQIEDFRKLLGTVEDNLPTANGEKQAFLKLSLERLLERLPFIDRAAPEERRHEVVVLREYLKRRIVESS